MDSREFQFFTVQFWVKSFGSANLHTSNLPGSLSPQQATSRKWMAPVGEVAVTEHFIWIKREIDLQVREKERPEIWIDLPAECVHIITPSIVQNLKVAPLYQKTQ